MSVGLTWIFFLLTYHTSLVEGRKIEDDLVYQEADAVRQRLTQVRQFLLPMPEPQWDRLVRHFGSLLVPVNAASEVCRNHSQHLLKSFLDQEIWALRMVDASSKFGLQSGILDGYRHDMGNYAQCVSVQEPDKEFRGQHCVVETSGLLPPEIADILIFENYPYLRHDGMFSLCVPSSCSDHDVKTHVDTSLAALGIRSNSHLAGRELSTDIEKVSCATAEGVPFRTKDYWAMFVFISLMLVVSLATVMKAQSGWLACFSLCTNLQELMDTGVRPGDITCLGGLRVVAILQVIFGHRMLNILGLPHQRVFTSLEVIETFAMTTTEFLCPLAVDIFFLFSGLTLSYSFLLKIRRKEDFSFFAHTLKRYFRMTPALAAVMLFTATLLIHLSSGPVWILTIAVMEDNCSRNWWSNLLQVNNIFHHDHMVTCMQESWYLACGFQLHCFAPVVLLLLVRRPRLGFVVTSVCILLSTAALTAAAFYAGIGSGYWVGMVSWDRLTDIVVTVVYKSPIIRAQAFLMGLALGYIMFYCKQKKSHGSLSKTTVWLGWMTSGIVFAGLLMVNRELVSPNHQYMPLLDPLFVGMSRQIYCACVSWLVFACHFGYGGCIDSFLSFSGFRPLAKLGLSVYLVHLRLQNLQLSSTQSAVNLRCVEQFFFYVGEVAASYIVATALYLTVELPFTKLSQPFIKDIERKSRRKKKQ